MSRRNVLIGAALVLAIVGVRVLKTWQSSPELEGRPGGSGPAAPRAPGASSAGRMRADVAPIPVVADPTPAGSLRLEGLVLGSDDTPAEGATVTLGTTPPRTARSDKGGSFLFEKLAPGAYRLEARRGGTVSAPVTAQVHEGAGPITLRLKPAAAVDVSVVDAKTRQGLPGAAVELRGEDLLSATAGADGHAAFEGIRPGKYVVKAAAPGHAPALQSLAVADAASLVKVTVELGSGAPASGEVRDAGGRPVAGIPVVAERSSTLISLADAREDGARTDERGRFHFPALAAGTYRFVASDAAHAPASSELTKLDGEHPREGIVIQVGESGRILGEVVTRTGDPVPFATVRAVVNEGVLGQVLARQTQCDAQGKFELGGLPRKMVDVAASHESATSDTHKVDLKEAPAFSGLTIPLDADATIPGVVVNAGGQPVQEAVVLAEPVASALRSRSEVTLRGRISTVADDGGKFTIRGLRPGASYLLRAAPPGTSLDRRTSWQRPPIKVEATGKEVQLRLEPDGRLKGQVAREEGGVPDLFTVTVDGAGSFLGLGGSGEFRIPDVPPGVHAVSVTGPSIVTKAFPNVEIRPDAETDLGVITVTSGRRISGIVQREDGSPVSGATVTVSRALSGPGVVAGPAAAQATDVRQAVSVEDGTYTLAGLGITPLNLGAEHPSEGRSPFVQVPPGVGEVKMNLVLKATGSLRGTVTQAKQPLGGALVLASARGAPAGGTGVTTGTDGTYVFESLTPGQYTVMVMLDAGGGQNIKQASVVVQQGTTAKLDMDLQMGTVTLVVHPVFQGGAAPVPVRVFLEKAAGATPPPQPGGTPPPGFQTQVLMGSDPARFSGVEPGAYRVCATRVPQGVDAGTVPGGTKMNCVYTTVAQGPSVQETGVPVPGSP